MRSNIKQWIVFISRRWAQGILIPSLRSSPPRVPLLNLRPLRHEQMSNWAWRRRVEESGVFLLFFVLGNNLMRCRNIQSWDEFKAAFRPSASFLTRECVPFYSRIASAEVESLSQQQEIENKQERQRNGRIFSLWFYWLWLIHIESPPMVTWWLMITCECKEEAGGRIPKSSHLSVQLDGGHLQIRLQARIHSQLFGGGTSG